MDGYPKRDTIFEFDYFISLVKSVGYNQTYCTPIYIVGAKSEYMYIFQGNLKFFQKLLHVYVYIAQIEN